MSELLSAEQVQSIKDVFQDTKSFPGEVLSPQVIKAIFEYCSAGNYLLAEREVLLRDIDRLENEKEDNEYSKHIQSLHE